MFLQTFTLVKLIYKSSYPVGLVYWNSSRIGHHNENIFLWHLFTSYKFRKQKPRCTFLPVIGLPGPRACAVCAMPATTQPCKNKHYALSNNAMSFRQVSMDRIENWQSFVSTFAVARHLPPPLLKMKALDNDVASIRTKTIWTSTESKFDSLTTVTNYKVYNFLIKADIVSRCHHNWQLEISQILQQGCQWDFSENPI